MNYLYITYWVLGWLVLGFSVYFMIKIFFGIPKYIRSVRLERLSRKYALTFKKYGDEKSESNFLSGVINNVGINFKDRTLVGGTLSNYSFGGTGLYSEPSIATPGSKNDLSFVPGTGALTIRLSEVNGDTYRRLGVAELKIIFEGIVKSEIDTEDKLKLFLEEKNMKSHILKNVQAGGFASMLAFFGMTFVIMEIYSNSNLFDFDNGLGWMLFFNALICVWVYVWVSKRFGKKFTSDSVNRPINVNPRNRF